MPMTYLIGLVFVSPSFAKKSSNLKTAHKKTTQFIQASSLKCCDLDARQASLNMRMVPSNFHEDHTFRGSVALQAWDVHWLVLLMLYASCFLVVEWVHTATAHYVHAEPLHSIHQSHMVRASMT